MTQRILMVVTSHNTITASNNPTGIWFEEFATPYAAFRNAGYDVTVASPKGGEAPIDPRSAPQGDEIVTHAHALEVLKHTLPINDINVSEYVAVFMPGGHGTMFDMPSAQVGKLVSAFATQNKPIAAVCHGPAGLVNAVRPNGDSLVKGYRVTGFTNAEEDAAQLTAEMPFLLQTKLSELGASFVESPNWNDHVIVDRDLVTGQNPQSSASTANALIRVIETLKA
jgi:putative intracellular protease/amidase